MENWVKVYSTGSLGQAEIYKSMLIENEVDAVVVNKLDSAYPVFGQAEVYVQTENEMKAKALIENEIKSDE